MVDLKTVANQPIDAQAHFASLLQELLSAPSTSMSAEEGFTLVSETISRLIQLLGSQHYREAPTNYEVQSSGLNCLPEAYESATETVIDSKVVKLRRRHLVQEPGPEQQKYIALLGRLAKIIVKAKEDYLASEDWDTFFRRSVQDAERAAETVGNSQPSQGSLRTLDQRRSSLLGPRTAFSGAVKRSDLAGSASNPYTGFTLVELRWLNKHRKKKTPQNSRTGGKSKKR